MWSVCDKLLQFSLAQLVEGSTTKRICWSKIIERITENVRRKAPRGGVLYGKKYKCVSFFYSWSSLGSNKCHALSESHSYIRETLTQHTTMCLSHWHLPRCMVPYHTTVTSRRELLRFMSKRTPLSSNQRTLQSFTTEHDPQHSHRHKERQKPHLSLYATVSFRQGPHNL
jgi:hypothetical protein